MELWKVVVPDLGRVTQPLLYKKIEAQPPLWQSYARRLGLTKEEIDRRIDSIAALGRNPVPLIVPLIVIRSNVIEYGANS